MDVREYLNQGYMLDQQIKCDMENLSDLKEAALTVSGLSYEERLFTPDNSNAGFVKILYKIDELREQIGFELNLFINLRDENSKVIRTVPTLKGQLVLHYRHIKHLTWESIGDELSVNERTVRRWYRDAIEHVVMPENPTDVNKILQKNEECPNMSNC